MRSRQMPGWAAVAYTPQELARAIAQGWTEADIAAYARWRGTVYDEPEALAAAAGEPRRPPPRAPLAVAPSPERQGPVWGTDRYLKRPDVADPAQWTLLPDGRLLSPPVPGKKRLSYSRESLMGRRVLERRRAAGLPTEP